jgi:predicted O-methyltransferase YrrM
MTGPIRRAIDRGLRGMRIRLEERESRKFAEAPFGRTMLAPVAEYQRLWTEARQRRFPAVDDYETASGSAIDPEWFHQLALLTQVPIKKSEICYQHGRLLYATLARYVRERARHHLTIVETGTARGFSALCMARALDDGGASGKILSFDVLPHDTPMLWNSIADAGGPRTRAELLGGYAELIERYVIFHRGDTVRELARVSAPRVHFAFLDSVHTYEHVMAEFGALRDRQAAGDVLFFDDYSPHAYPGVVAAADEICRTHGYVGNVVTANAHRRYLIAERQS